MSQRPLFRSDSESARATAWLGRIILSRPLSFGFLTLVAAAFALALAAFFVFGEYTRKSRVTGVLVPTQGLTRIIAPQSGKLVVAHVREGDSVEAEAPLFVIADTRANRATVEVAEAVSLRMDARRDALDRQRQHILAALESEQAALTQRSAGISREIDQIDVEIGALEGKLAITDYGLERAKKLEGIGFLSRAAREREEEGKLDQLARVESMRRTRLALSREFAAVEFEIGTARSRAQAQLAAIDQQRASLEQEHVERDAQFRATLVAPVAGTIGAILVEAGQMVTAGTTLATLIPANATLEAHLFTPSRSIGFVRDGQSVLVRFLAFPHQKFGSHQARVTAISRNPLAPGELGLSPADGSREPLYRIKSALDSQTISAYGKPQPLQAGMQLEADIHLDRRRLVEWIFEPLLSLAGRT